MQHAVVGGSMADFHARPVPEDLDEAVVWEFRADHVGLVLGSAQQEGSADLDAAAAAGVQVVRRRSGGGAVHVDPATSLWIDVVVPRADPLWSDDVRAATYWLGEAWQRALAAVGAAAEVHRGGLEPSPWGRQVCFGGLGPGEVVDPARRKLVGISQRRTRAGARFQCIAYETWDPRAVLDLLRMDEADRQRASADLADVAAGVGRRLGELRTALLDELLG